MVVGPSNGSQVTLSGLRHRYLVIEPTGDRPRNPVEAMTAEHLAQIAEEISQEDLALFAAAPAKVEPEPWPDEAEVIGGASQG
jgi:hypothetical protein